MKLKSLGHSSVQVLMNDLQIYSATMFSVFTSCSMTWCHQTDPANITKHIEFGELVCDEDKPEKRW